MRTSAEVSRKHSATKKSTSSHQRKLSANKLGSTNMGSAHGLESSASNNTIAAAAASARATASARASQRVTAYLEMLASGPLPPPSGTGTIPAKSTIEETKKKTTNEEKAWPQYLVPPVDLQSRSSLGRCLKSFLKLLSGERISMENIGTESGKGTAESLGHSRPRPRSLPVWECRGWYLSMPRTYSPLRRPLGGHFVPAANISALSQIHKQPPSDAANPQDGNTKRSRLSSSPDGTRKPQGRLKTTDCTDLSWCHLIKSKGERPRTAPQSLGVQRSRVSSPRLHTASHAATRGTTLTKRGSRVSTPHMDRRPLSTQVLAQQAAQDTLLQVLQNSTRNNKNLKKIQKSQGQAPKQSGRISPVRDIQTRLSKMATKTSVQRTTRPPTRGSNVATAPKPKRVKYTTFSGK